MGCVSQDSYPRKSILREQGKLRSKRTVKFSPGTWHQIKIQERKHAAADTGFKGGVGFGEVVTPSSQTPNSFEVWERGSGSYLHPQTPNLFEVWGRYPLPPKPQTSLGLGFAPYSLLPNLKKMKNVKNKVFFLKKKPTKNEFFFLKKKIKHDKK